MTTTTFEETETMRFYSTVRKTTVEQKTATDFDIASSIAVRMETKSLWTTIKIAYLLWRGKFLYSSKVIAKIEVTQR